MAEHELSASGQPIGYGVFPKVDTDQKAHPPSLDRYPPLVKKGLFEFQTDINPRTEYSDADVANRLAHPAGFVDASIFDEPASNSGIKGGLGRKISGWGMPSPDLEGYYGSRTYLGIINTVRKAYEGPVYLQGPHPTCNAWAGLHALRAAGLKPAAAFTRDLLNAALPRDNGEQGINTFALAGMIGEYYQDDVAVNILPMSSGKACVRRIASFVKTAIDGPGAAVSVVQTGEFTHAICVAGYNINEQGHMDLQVIDSACGVGVVTVESLTREVSTSHTMTPLMSIIKAPQL